MKIKALLAAGIVAILALATLAGCSAAVVTPQSQPAQAQPLNVDLNNQQTGIWVSGEGKVTVTPDIATITLGVSAQTPTVAEAQSQASTAMDKIMASLTSNGIAKKDMQTKNYSIRQVTRWVESTQKEEVIGYNVSNMIVAKIRDMDKVGKIIDDAVTAGGDFIRINGINFSVEDPSKYYVQARELAMNKAKDKAQQIAQLSGVTLGKPTYVSESSYTPPTPYPVNMYKSDMAVGAAAPTTSISAGEMDIVLDVQVAYAIQ
jgi:uncharacterized protein